MKKWILIPVILVLIGSAALALLLSKGQDEKESSTVPTVDQAEAKYFFVYPNINFRDNFVKMNTEELLAACLLYPPLPSYSVGSRKAEIEHLLENFIGFQLFMEREDRLQVAEAFDIEWVDFSQSGTYQKPMARIFLRNLLLYLKGELPDSP